VCVWGGGGGGGWWWGGVGGGATARGRPRHVVVGVGAGRKTGWRFTARIPAAPVAAPPDPRKPWPQTLAPCAPLDPDMARRERVGCRSGARPHGQMGGTREEMRGRG
jgi:hypothetical protein